MLANLRIYSGIAFTGYLLRTNCLKLVMGTKDRLYASFNAAINTLLAIYFYAILL